MEYPVILCLQERADPYKADLSIRELRSKDECRVIGGDKGDIHFEGYVLGDKKTLLFNPKFVTSLNLSKDDAQRYAEDTLMASYESIGIETVEHS